MIDKVKGMDLKIARLKAGFRQYEVAAKLGIPQSRLSEIEAGRRPATPEIIQDLFKILAKHK